MSLLNGLLDKVKKEAEKVAEAIKNEVDALKPEEASSEAPAATVVPGGHTGIVVGGGSVPSAPQYERDWYDEVPEEECQYNFEGPYTEYFKKIFAEDFPEYLVKFACLEEGRRYKYTLLGKDGATLVVELMTEKSAAQKLRRECLANGTPYLRFYFDHWGWWNTRAYVKERVAKALAR